MEFGRSGLQSGINRTVAEGKQKKAFAKDDGITNDVAIEEPFLLCFLSNGTDVPAAERAIREIALELSGV